MTEPKFEEALEKLEAIVSDLESGELKLDDAIKKYEEGVNLSNFCRKKLQEIEKKIEVLIKDSSGKITVKNFKESTGSDTDIIEAATQKKQAIKRKRPKGEELLF